MRADALGLFWRDEPVIKEKKAEKPKRQAPLRLWERPDWLPHLDKACADTYPEITDGELLCYAHGRKLIFDTEVYPNYFLAGFSTPDNRKVLKFELYPGVNLWREKLAWVLDNYIIVSFNGIRFDMAITALALAGCTTEQLKQAANDIIQNEERPYDVLRRHKVRPLTVNHIDLIEVAPLRASLKIYGGRVHSKKMMDLPFHHETWLSPEQRDIVRWYCIRSDIPNTALLLDELEEQLQLREQLSIEYSGIDLRSKSDAQIAEAVIGEELKVLNGSRPHPPAIEVGSWYRYRPPSFLRYTSQMMQWVAYVVSNSAFIVDNNFVIIPPEIENLSIQLAGGVYRMGNGGLHSSEKCTHYISDKDYTLIDVDMESFYPRIVLNLGLFPAHLGPNFLRVYRTLVDRRVEAKRRAKECKKAGDKAGEARWKVVADSLKITINGTFGKLGSAYSILYAPDLLTQVTMTGQLTLLMLIERLENENIHVVSANTDGIVIRVPNYRRETDFKHIIKTFEQDTGFTTEETVYQSIWIRDVNNYVAIKDDGTPKLKGKFANPWDSGVPKDIWRFHKNPEALICTQAVVKQISDKVPVEETIRKCRDITKFVTVRTVNGGAVHGKFNDKGEMLDGHFLGKPVRWYYATNMETELVYADSGKKVPKSTGAKPCLDLPDQFPEDVDFAWYEAEAHKMLVSLSYE